MRCLSICAVADAAADVSLSRLLNLPMRQCSSWGIQQETGCGDIAGAELLNDCPLKASGRSS